MILKLTDGIQKWMMGGKKMVKSLEEFIEKNCIKNGVLGPGLGCKDCEQAFLEVFSFCQSFEQMKEQETK